MTLKAGDSVEGRYKILKELDKGGMGSVFLAEHQLIKRRVALKLLRADLAEDADVLERFMNEARAAGTLGHPNIVESTDMGFTREGVPYIVFEFLEGSLLTDEIYRVHGLPVRRALRIARQIASALHAAHTAGVIHRDLKSDNVFLTDRDEAADHVKVLDFGISRFLELEDDPRGRAMVIGTPQFMAPEQITSPERVDRRTDIYALGVILYEMLTARRPFENQEDPSALFPHIVQDPPPPLEVPQLPPGLETMLFERLLAKNPEDRFATMLDVEAAFAAFAGIVRPAGRDSAPIPIALPVPTGPQVLAADVTPRPRRRGGGLLLAGAVVLGAGGGATFLLEHPAEPPKPPDLAPLRADADKLGATIEAAMHAAQLRADGLAQTPMLRAGVETDTATLQDMMHGDFALKLGPGEVFELLQLHEGAPVVVLRIPDGRPIPARDDHQPRLAVADGGLALYVSAAVQTQRGAVGGAVALAMPIDLAPIATQAGGHATGVTLRGLDAPVALVPAGPAGIAVEVPVTLPRELGVTASLAAVVPAPPPPPTQPPFSIIRIILWGLAGILGIAYATRLLRSRQRD